MRVHSYLISRGLTLLIFEVWNFCLHECTRGVGRKQKEAA
jgi:hypothetical protein